MPEPSTDELTIMDKARAEAAAAEAEEPATDPEPEPEPAPDDGDLEPEVEPEPEPEPAGRRGKSPQDRFQAAFARFVKTAAECFDILPAEVEVAASPGIVGVVLPGFNEPRTHENYTRCETCNGLGKVLTGASTGDPTKDLHTCPNTLCKGNGYWAKTVAAPEPVTSGPLAAVPAPAAPGEWAEAPAWMGDPSLSHTG
jgi:hypothetical protein